MGLAGIYLYRNPIIYSSKGLPGKPDGIIFQATLIKKGNAMLTVRTLNRILANVPDYKVFNTVAEMDANSHKLAAEHPEKVSISEIGKTRAGRPLYCLKIGSGSKNALLLGCPHPNEPIGAMMLEYFSRALVEDPQLLKELDYTWYIVKSWDADGTALNEGWFKGPFNLYTYARNFYRPPGVQQVDWTFPIDYKNVHFHSPIPETEAAMRLIEETRPVFNYTLHNAGFGGVYYYLSRPAEEIYDALRGAANKNQVPLNLGEPEAPYILRYSPAIYRGLGITEGYDYYEQYGVEHPEEVMDTGTCSSDFANSLCGTFTLLTELPYFYDKRIDDLSPSDILRKDAVLANLDASERANVFISATLEKIAPYASPGNDFKKALDAFIKYEQGNDATRKMVNENPEYAKLATQAEKFDNLLISRFYKSLSLGLLVRAAEFELNQMQQAGETDAVKQRTLAQAMRSAEEELKSLTNYLEENIHYEVVPIRKLVRIQLESGLIAADYVAAEDAH